MAKAKTLGSRELPTGQIEKLAARLYVIIDHMEDYDDAVGIDHPDLETAMNELRKLYDDVSVKPEQVIDIAAARIGQFGISLEEHASVDDRHWKMNVKSPHFCVNCNTDYNKHYPWPENPCPTEALIKAGKLKDSIMHMN